MDVKDRIHIAPVRGRLPRRYRQPGEPSRAQRWRRRGFVCLGVAAFWLGIWYVASR